MSGTSSLSACPTGPADRRRIRIYSIAHLSKAEWNDTRFQREDFGKLILAARGELDEGGVIVPMFNDSIGATNDKVGGRIDDPNGELTGGHGQVPKKGKAGGPESGSPAIISVLA